MSYDQRSVPVPTTDDRISSLPDSILYHILSFLPTKLSSPTTLLSKRWNSLWLSSPTLTLDTQSFKDFSTFCLFFYSLFMRRDSNLSIQSFHLRCRNTPDCDRRVLNSIVSAVVQRGGVQNISLCTEYTDRRVLNSGNILGPCIFSILSCRCTTTLVVLKLKGLIITDVPPIVHLPLLKTLNMDMAFFSSIYSFHRLLFGCPNLEDLHLCNVGICRFANGSEGKYQHFPKLVKVNLSYSGIFFSPFDWVHNAKFLRVYLINVIDMELILDSGIWQGEWKWKWVIEVLKHCPKLQNLTIDKKASPLKFKRELIVAKDWMYPETVPECLLYQLKTCLLKNYKGLKSELQFAEYVMQNSKQLGTMTVKSSCAVVNNAKLQMLVKLSRCSRGSGTCKLLFD